jgi:hypothetical protein
VAVRQGLSRQLDRVPAGSEEGAGPERRRVRLGPQHVIIAACDQHRALRRDLDPAQRRGRERAGCCLGRARSACFLPAA